MASQVYFTGLRAGFDNSLLTKIERLASAAGLKKIVRQKDLAAVKLHFGERGNTAFVRPMLVRPVVDALLKAGARPFVTDTGTLYIGSRSNAVDHLNTALLNGFAYPVIGAPLIIADGIDGADEVAVQVNMKHFREVFIATAIVHADSLISVAHFKLHDGSGIGGAIKNLGMGAASRKGKMAQHAGVAPQVIVEKCTGCGTCLEQCAHGAVALSKRSEKSERSEMVEKIPTPPALSAPTAAAARVSRIDPDLCVGCARCFHACPQQAISIDWEYKDKDHSKFIEKMVEYACGALRGKEKRSLFINFLTQISPACDCYPFADAPIVSDIGVAASTDPVAIDQACADMVNRRPHLETSCLGEIAGPCPDKIRAVYPDIDWRRQLIYASQLGLGSTEYELVEI
ncbi:MAG TPA: DUF362 domain-containing protein [Syntrophobacteraceae bacterium]|nr:DUF362 domain-containing protein [Syntrophobacteraceae bacterium]